MTAAALLEEVQALYLAGEIDIAALERGVTNAVRLEAKEEEAARPPHVDRLVLMPAAGQGCVTGVGIRQTPFLGEIAVRFQFTDWDTATADGCSRDARMRGWMRALSDALDRVEMLERESERPCPNCGDYALGLYGGCETCKRQRSRRGCARCRPHLEWRFGTEWRCAPCRLELGTLERLS